MPIVTTSEPLKGWGVCGRPTIADEAYGNAVQEEDCKGYDGWECEVQTEETIITFRDLGADAATSVGMNVDMPERTIPRIIPANGDWSCPFCSFEMSSFSLTPKPVYRRVSESHPDELRRRSLRRDREAEQTISIAERQAAALERLAKQGQDNARIAELEAQLAALTARLTASEPEDDPVDPPKRRTAPRAA